MNATVSWNANTESDLAGYIVYHGIASLVYTPAHTTTVSAATTSLTYTFLDVGITHYFNVKAFDTSGNESAFGGEVTKLEPFPVYGHDLAMRTVGLSRQMRDTDTAHMVSALFSEVLGLNVPPGPPPPETFPIYEAIGGFMVV